MVLVDGYSGAGIVRPRLTRISKAIAQGSSTKGTKDGSRPPAVMGSARNVVCGLIRQLMTLSRRGCSSAYCGPILIRPMR